jgi:DNA primase
MGEVIFTFDGDAAGQRAAQRAFGMEAKFATQTYVTVEPNGLDPCDLRLAHGDGAVRDLVARRVPLFEFAIKGVLGRHDLNTTEGQLAALDEAAPILARIKDQGLRTRYAVNLDRWLGLMDERFVLTSGRARTAVSRAGASNPARSVPMGTGGATAGRGATPASPTTWGTRSSWRSARCSSWRSSARPCAGPSSTRSAPTRSPPPCTARCSR